MGDDDWDISAVVRSCNINRPNSVVAPTLGLETSHDVWNSFDGLLAPDINNSNGLPRIFSIDLPIAHQEKPDDQVIIMNKNGNHQLYLHSIQPTHFIQQSVFPPSPTTMAYVPPPTTTPQEWIALQQQLHIGAKIYPNFSFSIRTPLIQTRTRKNQPIRIIYELLQEELANEIWTWLKYDQKHIKGSSFPRNYYKCSTSKFCEAKKTIEKSPKGENLFLVSYSGEHNHYPPANHRNLVGCNNSSKFNLPKGTNIIPKESILNASSSSSKHAKHSRAVVSPIVPTMPTLEIGRKNKKVVSAAENKGDGKEELNMNDDILMGFEELQGVTAST